jgi:GTP-binding protein EngB required for normal cell division|tara:strand:+ start:7506 stop:9248 length:1743 start_codon:yes stop_codon:yes gene_type:complete
MEISRKKEILNYLNILSGQVNDAADTVPELLKSQTTDWLSQLDDVAGAVAARALYVPVVGGFSVGKSTVLNTLLGRDVLPEKVTPETAIPAELHFSDSERIMALDQHGEWTDHDVTELGAISEKARDFQVVRVYLNSPVLKEIEPLVLVDMPGFDSGLDQHNQAILRYITSGALYFYLVDCKAGTINRQDSRRIEEILDLGRSVKVFMTKTDLAPEDAINDAREFFAENLSTIGCDSNIGLINKDDASAFLDELKASDADSLFNTMTLPAVKNLYFDADGMINTAISALASDVETVAQRVEEAQQALAKVEQDKERLLSEAKSGGISAKCDLVMSRLDQTLRSAANELVMQAKVSEAALSKSVADLVRATLTVEIQSLIRKTTSDITYQFSGDINIEGFSVGGDDWLSSLATLLESEVMDAMAGLKGAAGQKYDKKPHVVADNQNPLGKVIGSLGAIAVMIPNPVLRVVFAILPGIIGTLFDNFRENTQEDRFREAVSSQVIPTVMSQVRPQVMESLNAAETEIIRVVSEQVTSKLEKQKSLYDEVAQKSDAERQKLIEMQQVLESIRDQINKSAKGVFA